MSNIDYVQIIKRKGLKNTYIANALNVTKGHLTNLLRDQSDNFKRVYENDLRRLLDMPVETGFNDFHGTTILEGDEVREVDFLACYTVKWCKVNKLFYLEEKGVLGFLFLSVCHEKIEVVK